MEKEKSSFRDDPRYLDLIKEESKKDSLRVKAFDEAANHDEAIKSIIESDNLEAMLNGDKQEVIAFEKNYKPVDIFSMEHSFRTKNKMGALILANCKVILDTKLAVINVK